MVQKESETSELATQPYPCHHFVSLDLLARWLPCRVDGVSQGGIFTLALHPNLGDSHYGQGQTVSLFGPDFLVAMHVEPGLDRDCRGGPAVPSLSESGPTLDQE